MSISPIKQLRAEFLQEAESAPKLFKDLAKVELYIAESYKTRALIELIQNADDANATDFGIHSIEGGFIVANNGRAFTSEDVEALCRSGSSNKQRGGNTIGYRGIGFKSVVNLANKISVFSGDFSFYFDRNITKLLLKTEENVPLIRVPHPADDGHVLENGEVTKLINEFQYKTIFVFQDVIEEISLQELLDFDRSSLLFLNNLRSVVINYKSIQRKIQLHFLNNDQRNTIKILEANNCDEWEVINAKNNNNDRVAFKKAHGLTIPASPLESVIHSFTPTYEFSGAYIKINGDFTTDPSRKTLDMDEVSKKSLQNSISIIVDCITTIIDGDLTKVGFFTPFVNIQVGESNRLKMFLFKGIRENLEKTEIKIGQGKTRSFLYIRLKPDWLNYDDYEKLCSNGLIAISKDLITAYPELFQFLSSINTKTLTLEEIIPLINVTRISLNGSAQIFGKIIKQFRYDLDFNRIEKLKSLKLFPVGESFVTSIELNNISEIQGQFLTNLNDNIDSSDISLVFRKLGHEMNNISNKALSKIPVENFQSESENAVLNSVFKAEPVIKKWRSSEQNAAEYLRALEVVISVKDVTQANLGYDLEVMLTNGKRLYVEIKSVSSFSEAFKISNNEYSSAHSYGKDYCIGLVINVEPFMIKFVSDPIKELDFEKKCERWSWFCENYNASLQTANKIFTLNI